MSRKCWNLELNAQGSRRFIVLVPRNGLKSDSANVNNAQERMVVNRGLHLYILKKDVSSK